VGPHHVWIFGETVSADSLSTLGGLTRGSVRVAQAGDMGGAGWADWSRVFRSANVDDYDPYLAVYEINGREINTSRLEPDYFETARLYDVSAFAYDAVAALGIAKCRVRAPGVDALHAVLSNVSFAGASGAVSFRRGSRATANIVIENFVPNATGGANGVARLAGFGGDAMPVWYDGTTTAPVVYDDECGDGEIFNRSLAACVTCPGGTYATDALSCAPRRAGRDAIAVTFPSTCV
jgi:hypothetical protein